METLNIQQNIFTKYHYRVWVYVSTLNADKFKTDTISDTDDFTNTDLKIARDAAVNRYWQIYETMHQSKGFFLPFAAADNFETGKNALFSIGLFLIETTEDGEFEVMSKMWNNLQSEITKAENSGRSIKIFHYYFFVIFYNLPQY